MIASFSRWQRHAFFLDPKEMFSLLETLSPVEMFNVSGVVSPGNEQIDCEQFLSLYEEYFSAVLEKEGIDLSAYRKAFTTAWTRGKEAISFTETKDHRKILRANRPVLQLQMHQFRYDHQLEKFFAMSCGKGNISWGIQISFPMIFQKGPGEPVVQVKKGDTQFDLYTSLVRFLRKETLPTPFLIDGKRKNATFRIGKKVLSDIEGNLPQLEKAGILLSSSETVTK